MKKRTILRAQPIRGIAAGNPLRDPPFTRGDSGRRAAGDEGGLETDEVVDVPDEVAIAIAVRGMGRERPLEADEVVGVETAADIAVRVAAAEEAGAGREDRVGAQAGPEAVPGAQRLAGGGAIGGTLDVEGGVVPDQALGQVAVGIVVVRGQPDVVLRDAGG